MNDTMLSLHNIRFAYPCRSTNAGDPTHTDNSAHADGSANSGDPTHMDNSAHPGGSASSGGAVCADELAFALDVPSFALPAGRIVALTGPNGGGKTTLGKLAAGLLHPSVGQVRVAGEDIAAWSLGRIGAKVGYLFQDPDRQLFASKVLDELAFPLTLRGVSKHSAHETARAHLQTFGLSALEDRATFSLSRGEKQRLAIAALAMCDPAFFVLDEPTTALDAQSKSTLSTMLHALAEQGKGILLISHDLAFVRENAQEALSMRGGKLLEASRA